MLEQGVVMNPSDGPAEIEVTEDVPDACAPDPVAVEPASDAEQPWSSSGPTLLIHDCLARLDEISKQSSLFHERAAAREAVLDRMYAEIDRLRSGERRQLLRPLLVDLIGLRNDLLQQSRELPESYSPAQAARLLESFAESVGESLQRHGVVAFTPEIGEKFDFRKHRKVGHVGASEGLLDPLDAVAAVRADGYLDLEADKLIAPAEVLLGLGGVEQAAAVENGSHVESDEKENS